MGWKPIPGYSKIGNEESPVAVLTLNDDFVFDEKQVAIYGKAMTENLGITRIISNVLSNPNLRYLVVCGRDVHGHFPGDALISFYEKGYEVNEYGTITIKDTKAADPKLPIDKETIEEVRERLRKQISLVNMIGETDLPRINRAIEDCLRKKSEPMEYPYDVKLKKAGDIISVPLDKIAICAETRLNDSLVCKR